MSDGDHSAKPNGGWPPSPRLAFAECLALPRARHSAKGGFAECYPLPNAWHSAKKDMPSVWLCRVRHSAKCIFAECPTFGTRQSRKHSAKPLFPVVITARIVCMLSLGHTRDKPKIEKMKWLFFGESKNGCSKGTFLSQVLHHTETYAWFSKQRENGMSEKGNQPTNKLVAVLRRVKDLRCHVLMDLYGYMRCNKKTNKHCYHTRCLRH